MDLTGGLASKAVEIVQVLRRAGYEAYFAGGCVRDFLLGRNPLDIDIATSASPDTVSSLLPKVIPVGLKYGVVSVVAGEHSFEVATFRRDVDYADGRHPTSVEFADSRHDALRRDFTVNGMFYEPLQKLVVDYVSGIADLQKKVIRTIGQPQQRFLEDKLRMMRAVRLACSLDFQIEPDTFSAIAGMAHCILEVSWERIRDELLKMFAGPRPARALDLLDTSGLLVFVLPEVSAAHDVAQPPQFHPEGDVYTHTRMMFELMGKPTPTLALGVLLHDIGKPITFDIKERIRFDLHVDVGCVLADDVCQRLKLSREETDRIVDLVRHHLRFMHVREMRESTLKRFLRIENFPEHLELHRLDCLASHGDVSNWEFCRNKLDSLSREQVLPPPLLTGDDLIGMGYRPGPVFKEMLRALEDAQLDGLISSREEAIEFVASRYSRNPT